MIRNIILGAPMPSLRLASVFLPALLAAAIRPAAAGAAEEKVLNVYSARHYQTDESLYAEFTRQTGIKVNRIEGKEDELLERIKNEGAYGPADVYITVDAARLGQADALGAFMPVSSKTLEERIPANLRTGTWFAFSTRARVIVYDKAALKPADVQDYESLANPKLRGKVCVRSGSHPYNLSLGSALIAHLGEERTEQWAKGLVANLARAPKGGDTDQIRAVAAGECQVALANSYYVARLMRSAKPQDQEVMKRVAVVWPNQGNHGTHVNVSGAGVVKSAPHPQAAIRFLEYLASDAAQAHFADGNNEWPVVKTAAVKNPALEALGPFKADPLDVATLTKNTALAQRIFDRAGWR
jgi:iron(III) transport system substrate-binding protein